MEGGDVAALVNGFTGIMSDFLRTFVLRNFNEPMRDALTDLINQFLKPKELLYERDGIEIDYTLVDDGVIVSDKYISAIFDGTFHPNTTAHSELEKTYNILPNYLANGRDL